jgi:hypothetical protein
MAANIAEYFLNNDCSRFMMATMNNQFFGLNLQWWLWLLWLL